MWKGIFKACEHVGSKLRRGCVEFVRRTVWCIFIFFSLFCGWNIFEYQTNYWFFLVHACSTIMLTKYGSKVILRGWLGFYSNLLYSSLNLYFIFYCLHFMVILIHSPIYLSQFSYIERRAFIQVVIELLTSKAHTYETLIVLLHARCRTVR